MLDEEDEGPEEEESDTPHEEEKHDFREGSKEESNHGLATAGVSEQFHYTQEADKT